MAGSAGLLALCDAGWPGAGSRHGLLPDRITALSWHGILLAETARASPEICAGGVTGGVCRSARSGAGLARRVFGRLDTTGSYGIGFIVCGLPALFCRIQLLRQR